MAAHARATTTTAVVHSSLSMLNCSAYPLATNDLLIAVGRIVSLTSLSLRASPYVTDAGLAHLAGPCAPANSHSLDSCAL